MRIDRDEGPVRSGIHATRVGIDRHLVTTIVEVRPNTTDPAPRSPHASGRRNLETTIEGHKQGGVRRNRVAVGSHEAGATAGVARLAGGDQAGHRAEMTTGVASLEEGPVPLTRAMVLETAIHVLGMTAGVVARGSVPGVARRAIRTVKTVPTGAIDHHDATTIEADTRIATREVGTTVGPQAHRKDRGVVLPAIATGHAKTGEIVRRDRSPEGSGGIARRAPIPIAVSRAVGGVIAHHAGMIIAVATREVDIRTAIRGVVGLATASLRGDSVRSPGAQSLAGPVVGPEQRLVGLASHGAGNRVAPGGVREASALAAGNRGGLVPATDPIAPLAASGRRRNGATTTNDRARRAVSAKA